MHMKKEKIKSALITFIRFNFSCVALSLSKFIRKADISWGGKNIVNDKKLWTNSRKIH